MIVSASQKMVELMKQISEQGQLELVIAFIKLLYQLITLLLNHMAEQTAQYDPQQMITSHQDHPAVSFPKIQPKRIATRGQATHKNMISLPALQSKQQIRQQIRQLKMLKQAQHKGEQEIVNQIQQKMKQVLEILNNGSSNEQNITSDDVQFEDEIKLNKQKIKQAISSKERKQQKSNSPSRQIDSNSRSRHMQRYHNKNTLNLNKRSLSSYEHEVSKRANQQESRKKGSLQIEDSNMIKYKEKPIIGLPPKNHKQTRIESSKKAAKQINESKQPQNIFDGIQNMLQNPKTRIHSVESHGNQKQIQKLQKKLRLLNQKLGKDEQSQTKQSFMSEQLINNTVHDWKRLSYNGGKFVCRRDSNFQKQMEKVAKLQCENEQKIVDLVNNQLQLINLNYLKRAYSKMNKNY